MPVIITHITDLRTIPVRRRGPVNDEISAALLKGSWLEETEGVDFAARRVHQRRDMLRHRARRRGLKQISSSQLDEQGRVILRVQWYREQRGDLRVIKPATRASYDAVPDVLAPECHVPALHEREQMQHRRQASMEDPYSA